MGSTMTKVLLADDHAMVRAGLRWLRVAQREHYLPGAPIRFALRWWSSEPINLVLAARSRAIEFEPEPPPEPRFKISSPVLVGALLILFVLSVGFLLFHAR